MDKATIVKLREIASTAFNDLLKVLYPLLKFGYKNDGPNSCSC